MTDDIREPRPLLERIDPADAEPGDIIRWVVPEDPDEPFDDGVRHNTIIAITVTEDSRIYTIEDGRMIDESCVSHPCQEVPNEEVPT